MTESEKRGRFFEDFPEEKHEPLYKAMESMFELEEAIREGELSIDDLARVIPFALKEGHDQLSIALFMSSKAVELAKQENH